MTRNLELNLGQYEDPLLAQVESWYDEVWEEAVPFDLAELYEVLFQEFSPWLIYLRVLWELYGDEVEEEEDEIGHLMLTRFQKHGNWRARRILDEFRRRSGGRRGGLGEDLRRGRINGILSQSTAKDFVDSASCVERDLGQTSSALTT